jgi:hypothetical protein
MPRTKAFPGYDEPVNIDGDPEEVLRALLADDPEDQEDCEPTNDDGETTPPARS